MNDQTNMAQLRYLEELKISLVHAGFEPERMLHHMGRIFEDNSKADGTLYGLRIDRKRRRELQRKRLAMGHKPDDHEEISHT